MRIANDCVITNINSTTRTIAIKMTMAVSNLRKAAKSSFVIVSEVSLLVEAEDEASMKQTWKMNGAESKFT